MKNDSNNKGHDSNGNNSNSHDTVTNNVNQYPKKQNGITISSDRIKIHFGEFNKNKKKEEHVDGKEI